MESWGSRGGLLDIQTFCGGYCEHIMMCERCKNISLNEQSACIIYSQLTSIQAAHQQSTRQSWKHPVADSGDFDVTFLQ